MSERETIDLENISLHASEHTLGTELRGPFGSPCFLTLILGSGVFLRFRGLAGNNVGVKINDRGKIREINNRTTV